MQPTPTRSPCAKRITSEPTSATMPGHLVTRDRGIGDLAPLATGEVDVRMADPAELDVGPDIPRADRSPLDLQSCERGVGRRRAHRAGSRGLAGRRSESGLRHAGDARRATARQRGAAGTPPEVFSVRARWLAALRAGAAPTRSATPRPRWPAAASGPGPPAAPRLRRRDRG